MKYAYEDLSDGQFEKLMVFLCQHLLGISVQCFAKGPDGGRDAKFVGIAELHPSKAAPWVGTTIIQAKHTSGYNRNFSESDFFSTTRTNTVLGKEIPRIKKLRENTSSWIITCCWRTGASPATPSARYVPISRRSALFQRLRSTCAAWNN